MSKNNPIQSPIKEYIFSCFSIFLLSIVALLGGFLTIIVPDILSGDFPYEVCRAENFAEYIDDKIMTLTLIWFSVLIIVYLYILRRRIRLIIYLSIIGYLPIYLLAAYIIIMFASYATVGSTGHCVGG